MWKRMIFLVFAVGLLAACGTADDKGQGADLKDVEYGKEEYKKLTEASNALGFHLLKDVERDDNQNVFISPMSVTMALSMVYNGADGETKEGIADALQLQGIDPDELRRANASLLGLLDRQSDNIEVRVANSIWLSDQYEFQQQFAERSKKYFQAELQNIDVQDSNSTKQINDWVDTATNGKIEEIVEGELPGNLVAMLLNALYFKGDWTYAFDEQQTQEAPFSLPDGTEKEVPFMSLTKNLQYQETDEFQAVKLPYGKGELAMTIFLPTDMEYFSTQLTTEQWQKWNEQFQMNEGTVLLPKFQMEYETKLNEPLSHLGMERAFDPEQAEFSKLVQAEGQFFISEVKQKTYIDVNEQGTEAAAVTSVEVRETSAAIDPPFFMDINRPFVFTITDEESGMILFAGQISNPQIAES